MKLVSVLSFLRRSGSQTGCNYFLPGTGSVWRTKCTQNTLVTIGLVCTKHVLHTHTHDHKRTGMHTHKNKLQMNTDTEQAQLFPLVVLLYCDSSQGEIDLLINSTNAVWFLTILKRLFARVSCHHMLFCCY